MLKNMFKLCSAMFKDSGKLGPEWGENINTWKEEVKGSYRDEKDEIFSG